MTRLDIFLRDNGCVVDENFRQAFMAAYESEMHVESTRGGILKP